ncbi:hypothetical protein ACFOWX_06845 [Sphingorhabdus arenilitoris]|uniref:Uncharacterized protein n=1 Tax=Sphingorhabdus arenilitoris TaxID=1490041 RepID=A0ABV8RFI1_9SPHN
MIEPYEKIMTMLFLVMIISTSFYNIYIGIKHGYLYSGRVVTKKIENPKMFNFWILLWGFLAAIGISIFLIVLAAYFSARTV